MSTGFATSQIAIPMAVVSQPKLDWKFWRMVAMALLAVATLLSLLFRTRPQYSVPVALTIASRRV
jgi:hypothetical protein